MMNFYRRSVVLTLTFCYREEPGVVYPLTHDSDSSGCSGAYISSLLTPQVTQAQEFPFPPTCLSVFILFYPLDCPLPSVLTNYG